MIKKNEYNSLPMLAGELCVKKTDSKSKGVKKHNRMIIFSEEIILWYLPTVLGFPSVILCPNVMTMHAKGRYHSRN